VTSRSADETDIAGRESRSLIGFDERGAMILLDRTARPPSIRAFELPSGPETLLFEVGDSSARSHTLSEEYGWRKLEAWSDREMSLIFKSEAALGDRRKLLVLAARRGLAVRIAEIPIDEETAVEAIVRAPDERYAILRLVSKHRERVHVVDLKAARAAIENRRALDAYERGELGAAAALLEGAVAADPRSGEAIYNLACMHALLGDVERAADELAIAVAISPEIYRRIAKTDPDLAAVRNLDRMQKVLGIHAGVPN
jgi:hypothetical protein